MPTWPESDQSLSQPLCKALIDGCSQLVWQVAIKALRTGEEPLSSVGKVSRHCLSCCCYLTKAKYIHRELYIWQRLHHPHVTKLLGIMTASNTIIPGHSICMISPFREKGNLYTYLERHPDVDKIALVGGEFIWRSLRANDGVIATRSCRWPQVSPYFPALPYRTSRYQAPEHSGGR